MKFSSFPSAQDEGERTKIKRMMRFLIKKFHKRMKEL